MPKVTPPWIPVRKGLVKTPEVLMIAGLTGRSRREVVAILIEFWEWADEVSADGILSRFNFQLLSALIPDTNEEFWCALMNVGWIRSTSDSIVIPHYEFWMGCSAKKRLLDARRKQDRYYNLTSIAEIDRRKDGDKSENFATRERERERERIESNTPPNPQGGKRVQSSRSCLSNEQQQRFDRWYSTYPKKVGVAHAVKAWQKIKPDEHLTAEMIAAVERQKQTDQWQRGIVPNPATWLNGQRWKDDAGALDLQRGKTGATVPVDRQAEGLRRLQEEMAKVEAYEKGLFSTQDGQSETQAPR